MNITFPTIILAVSGIVVTIILFIAAKYLAVPVDEKVEEVRNELPGANCGACGYSGCDGYAVAVANGEAATNLCIPAGMEVAKKIAEIVGGEAGEMEIKKAFIHCHGDCDKTKDKYEYTGVKTCEACNMLYGGKGVCSYGCLGFGDCKVACAFGAIKIENGVAIIDKGLCTGCKACINACPKHIISMIKETNVVKVACSSKAAPKVAMKACEVACIGCKKCEKTCQNDAIHVKDFLATIDDSKCTNCEECIGVCPKNCIIKGC